MCQQLVWDCWWINCCKGNAGIAAHLVFGGFWLSKPHSMQVLNPNHITLGQWVGCGGNCLYCGSMCCVPGWMQEWEREVVEKQIRESNPFDE